MKIIKIGRSSSNDIVVNDGLVTRVAHCQIIVDDYGNCRLIDNSTNGTFVNGTRIGKGAEIRLNKSDIIRIGNSTLPWQTYLNNAGGTEIGGRTEIGSSGGYYPEPPKGSGFGITALICGIVGLFILTIILGPLAIIFGGVSLSRNEKNKGLGITGLVLGIINVILGIILLVYVRSFFFWG